MVCQLHSQLDRHAVRQPAHRDDHRRNTCQEDNTSLGFWSRYADTPATDGTNAFDWTGDQMVSGSNLIRFDYGGNSLAGPFSPGVATIPLSQLESPATDSAGNPEISIPVNLYSCAGGPNVVWGTSLLVQGSTIYVYGWLNHQIYLAQTSLADLGTPFNGWSLTTAKEPRSATRAPRRRPSTRSRTTTTTPTSAST